MKHLALILGGIGLAAAALAPTNAAAQSVARHQVSHGTAACQAATSRSRIVRSASRRSRHCPASMASSISAMFNQLPCLGV